MASSSYSFLDIVVLDGVRERFAAGDALAVLSTSLEEILWANGPGAAWLGFPNIEAAIGERPRLSAIALRQIAATPGFPHVGRDRTIALRVTSGLTSKIVAVQASAITLPHGEEALLLAVPSTTEAAEPAERTISGLSEPGHFAALLEADGSISAASAGFELLGIERETLLGLIQDVSREAARLVKKRIPARTQVAAGLARLTDDPARHLLVVVEDGTAGPSASDHLPASSETTAREASPSDTSRLQSPQPLGPTPEPQGSEAPPAPRTVRFSWRTDAHGRFTSISEEFTESMGRNATDVIGRTFREVSNAFGLDADGSICRLLERRDTWSGRTVMWPLQGTNLKVPVDLAALPIYGRGRVFEGFRGFGIARLSDAEVDPEAIGEVLAPALSEPSGAETLAGKEDAQEPVGSIDPQAGEKAVPSSLSGEPDPVPAEALTTTATQTRSNENVVQLAEHRESGWNGSLSASERTAFREIGERLRRASESRATAAGVEEGKIGELSPHGRLEESLPNDDLPAAASLSGDALGQTERETQKGDRGEDSADKRGDLPSQPQSTEAPEAPVSLAEDMEGAGETEQIVPLEPAGSVDATSQKDITHIDSEPEQAERETEPASAEEVSAEPDLSTETDTQQEATAAPPVESHTDADGHEPQAGSGAELSEEVTATGDEGQIEPEATEEAEPSEPSPDGERVPERSSQIAYLPSAFHRPDAERRQAEAETILAHLPLPVLIHSGDRLHYANREFFKLTGYSDLAELEAAGGIGALFDEPAAGAPERERLLLRRADGTDGPVEAHLQSVAWAGKKALMLALNPAGLSERTPEEAVKAAELESSLSEMRAIVDTATDGVAVIGNDGTIRSINRPAEALFGFDAENVTGKPFTSLFAIESQRTVQDYLAGLSDNGVASVLNDGRQVIGREAQGRFIPLFITIGRLPNGSGYCAVLRDITHWKRAEEELTQARAQAERASSQKSEFLARVSHEIRTPLNAIIGFSELMIDEKFGPIGNDRYRDYLRDINRSGNHVLDLVNDLLDISKIEAGQQEMAHEAVPLNDTLAQVIAMMQPQANRERVIIRSSLASRLPDVVADLRSVRQIAINLLSNAVRYTPAGGQVVVSTVYERDGSVVLRVRDTGVGMSSAELDEALKPFRQINALRRKRGDGTGLGLPLTRAMVEANRAQFSIASTPGEGTLVEITFPPTRVLAE